MISINKDKCTGCAQCTAICAGLVLKMEEGFPVYSGKGCIACGHCEALCPAGAITLDASLTAAEPAHELEKLIMSRRSIRRYKPLTPDRDIIENALNKAQWAPSSKNQRLNGWSIVLGKDKTDALLEAALDWCRENKVNRGLVRLVECGYNLVTCNAPCLIFAWIPENAINHELDCAIAMCTAEIMLHKAGLGSCWGGFVTRLVASSPELKELAGIPADARVCCTLMLGIPDEEYTVIPHRPKAKIIWKD